MRVLVFSQYYPPEVGATQNRLHHFARGLAAAGHEVTVITEVPNHPAGIIAPEYRGRLWARSVEDGVTVLRLWVVTSPRKTFFVRIGFYLSYALGATLAALLLARGRFDVCFTSSPPLTVGLPAWIYGKLRRVPFVLDVRDLWPVLAVELGEMRNQRVYALARKLELLLYRDAAAVTVVTRGFERYVREQDAAVRGLTLLPNGTMPEVFHPVPRDPALRHGLGLRASDFVVGFYGNHGIAQDLEGVVEAAARLRARDDVRFLFVGEGPVKAALQGRARALGLNNVVFAPQVPQREVVRFIALADVVVVPLRRMELLKTFIPSKLFDFMACAQPILLQVDGEAREVLEQAGAGWFVEPGDSTALAERVEQVAALPADQRAAVGRAGLDFVLAHYLRDQQVIKLERLLRDVASPGPEPGVEVQS